MIFFVSKKLKEALVPLIAQKYYFRAFYCKKASIYKDKITRVKLEEGNITKKANFYTVSVSLQNRYITTICLGTGGCHFVVHFPPADFPVLKKVSYGYHVPKGPFPPSLKTVFMGDFSLISALPPTITHLKIERGLEQGARVRDNLEWMTNLTRLEG